MATVDAEAIVEAFRARALQLACQATDDMIVHLPSDAVIDSITPDDVAYPWLLAEIHITASRLIATESGLARQPSTWNIYVSNHKDVVVVSETHRL